MRFRLLILASFLLLAFFALNAQSQDEATSVDQYLNASNGLIDTSTRYTPQLSRASQVGQKGKDILSQQIGGKLTTGSLTPQEARNQDQAETIPQSVVMHNTTPVQSEPTEVPSISGTWYLELVDNTSRNATLILLQSSSGAVYGKGTITQGNDTFTAAASGSIAGDALSLDLVPLEKLSLYKIALTVGADSATGGYDLYSPDSVASVTGTANAMKIS
jgi:hypothetical protein